MPFKKGKSCLYAPYKVFSAEVGGSALLARFENTPKGKVIANEQIETVGETVVVNDGTIQSNHSLSTGASFVQNGALKGKTLKIGKNTAIISSY